MKKLVVSLSLLFAVHKADACADVNLDYEYFNLFAQEMIHAPEYEPFYWPMTRLFMKAKINSEAKI